MSDRGSGRTTRQLAALPDGGVFLVPNMKMARYCRELLRHNGRARDAITFVTADLAEQHIRGRRVGAWDVDHAYFYLAGHRGERAYNCLGMAAGKGPLATA